MEHNLWCECNSCTVADYHSNAEADLERGYFASFDLRNSGGYYGDE